MSKAARYFFSIASLLFLVEGAAWGQQFSYGYFQSKVDTAGNPVNQINGTHKYAFLEVALLHVGRAAVIDGKLKSEPSRLRGIVQPLSPST